MKICTYQVSDISSYLISLMFLYICTFYSISFSNPLPKFLYFRCLPRRNNIFCIANSNGDMSNQFIIKNYNKLLFQNNNVWKFVSIIFTRIHKIVEIKLVPPIYTMFSISKMSTLTYKIFKKV